MPVHGCANVVAAGTSAPLAELVLITKYEWVQRAVSACGLLAQRRTGVVAGLGGVRAIAGTDVSGAAGVNAIWTDDGAGGDHPRVGRSCADVADGGAAGAVSAGRYFDSPFISPVVVFSLPVGDLFFSVGDSLSGSLPRLSLSLSLLFPYFFSFPFSPFCRAHEWGINLLLSFRVLFEYAVSTASVLYDFIRPFFCGIRAV